ncbi:MAG: hypothetical protein ABSG99_09155 [Sedimentisphaerales bacterium]
MQTKIITLAIVTCCWACLNQAQATEFDFTISSVYINDYFTLNDQSLLVEGAGVNEVRAYEDSYIEIRNTTPYEWKVGGVGRAILFDQSSINIYGGETGGIVATDNSSVNIYGGEVHGLIVADNSSATLYGGNIGGIRNSQSVPIGTEIDLEVVCKSWTWNESINHITGIWGDDSSFDIGLVNTSWDNFEDYRMIDHISFTVIPEPLTGILMAMGVLFLRRRR